MLPIFKHEDKNIMLLQTNWATNIDPVLKNPVTNGIILKNIALISGQTIMNHKLGRLPQGWLLIDVNAPATIYRDVAYTTQTITLTSDVACTGSFYVF